MDNNKIDLSKSYRELEQKPSEVPAEKPKEEVKDELKETKVTGEEGVSEEKPRVTYSRFKNVHQRAIDAEQEARVLQARLEELESRPREKYEAHDGEIPDFWKKLYGDSDASKEAWTIQSRREQQLLEEAEERALLRLEERQSSEASRQQDNLQTIDDNLENLTAFIGRDLTEKEQSSVLDIVDEFTPKGEDGKYLGEILSFEKAWEIYELKNEANNASTRSSRNQVANLTSSGSQGEPSESVEKDKSFNPSWGALGEALRKRL